MKKIVGYLHGYLESLNKQVFLFSTLFTALAVFCNYHLHLNRRISRLHQSWQFVAWYSLFLLVFLYGYWLQTFVLKSTVFRNRMFVVFLLLAPAIFGWKMSFSWQFSFAGDIFQNEYWNAVAYWPVRVAVVTIVLWLVHRVFGKGEPFYGVTTKHFTATPYLIMLLAMVPLIAAASTQRDFLHMYPRFQNIEYLLPPERGWLKVLFELSYGSDFFSIELFFRGFLVLAFARWAGKDAILPMAIFYCTIHFGKPLGECISSYFGGIILGVFSYYTRSIFGGFLVHLGIAWLMEAGGYLGHHFG